jgi:ABC-type proline/glycine betaine transport system permease subunit
MRKVKNGNSEHDFDSIAETQRRQNAVLEILVQHLAYVEATVSVLAVQAVPDEAALHEVKKLKDDVLSKISGKIKAELERLLEDS